MAEHMRTELVAGALVMVITAHKLPPGADSSDKGSQGGDYIKCMKNKHGRPCSIAAALSFVGDRWALIVIREVIFGNHTFSEIVRNTGAPRDRLAARLKTLVAGGVLEQRQYQEHPPRYEYHLTQAGRELAPVLSVLRAWGDKWAVEDPPLSVTHHGHPVRLRIICETCGEPVRQDEMEITVNAAGWDLAGPVNASKNAKEPHAAPKDSANR